MVTNKKSRLTALLLVLVLMMSLLPSAYAAADVDPDIWLTTSKGTYIAPGDSVSFTIDVTNLGDDNWNTVKLTSTLTFLQITAGSVKIDGVTSGYTFTAAGKLTVNLGTITPGSTKTVTFDATILDNVAAVVNYSFSASGYNTSGQQRHIAIAAVFFPITHVSAAPAFNKVTEGDDKITGTGVTGAVVTVTLPDNSTYNVPVVDGKWTLDVPAGKTLYENDIIKAYQKEPDKLVSPTVQTTVVANPEYKGEAKKESKNLTTLTGDVANIGDTILYTITAKNTSTPSSKWPCIVTDKLSDYVDLVANSVKVNNVNVLYKYENHVLTVDLGNIEGGDTKTLTFEVTINDKANGQTIENTANVGEIEVKDDDPPVVKGKSAAPTINDVLETADVVTGEGGIPGAEITVTFEDGETVTTIVDDLSGKWSVEVPPGTELNPGDKITAIQEEPDKDPSDEASTIVKGDTTVIKFLKKESKNLTTLTGDKANVGDIIEYTVTVGNSGTSSSTWLNCVVTDVIPDGVTFVAGSVKVNGQAYSNFTYVGSTLTVNLGNITGGDIKLITFQVKINNDAHNKIIENTATVGDKDAKDPDPPVVKEKSKTPTINDVIESDTTITGGNGELGATVTVTLPNGTTVTTTVTDPGGTWTVNVPNGVTLKPDEVITAVQKHPDKDVSDPATTIVKPNPDAVPSLKKESKNLTTTTGDFANVGDTIEYTVTAENEGIAASEWACVVTDEISTALTFVPGSVTINGTPATALQYSYNSASRVLTVNLGTIKGGDKKVITFRCTINNNTYSQTIENTAMVGDETKGKDEDPPTVIDQSKPPTIDPVRETDPTVTGEGVPGADIVVTFPDGSQVPGKVDDNGDWEVEVPDNVTLNPGDEIKAKQTEDGKAPSDEVKTIVIGDTTVDPRGEITWYNLFGGLTAKAGDYIVYEAQIWNDGTASSTWQSAVAKVKLHEDTAFADFVQIGGITVSPDRWSYDSGTHTLTVNLGNIIGQRSTSFSFRVQVNDYVPDTVTQIGVSMKMY